MKGKKKQNSKGIGLVKTDSRKAEQKPAKAQGKGAEPTFFSGCANPSQLMAFVEGTLNELDRKRFEKHLIQCHDCLRKVASYVRVLDPSQYTYHKPSKQLIVECCDMITGQKKAA